MRIDQVALRLAPVERVLIGLEILLSIGALAGAVGLMSGSIDLGESAGDLPFDSPFLGGVALAVLNGVLPAIVARAAVLRKPWAPTGHIAVGVVLAVWITVQVAFIGLGAWLQVIYFGYGLLIIVLGLVLVRRGHAEG